MTKILFVCHGNICRSPMAEFIMKDIVTKHGVSKDFEIASVATSTEELGNPVYPPARRKLQQHGISCLGKTARQITESDLAYYDMIIVMDTNNVRNMRRMFGDKCEQKMSKLMSYTGSAADVADPWYTGDFDQTYADISTACLALLTHLTQS